MLLWLWSCLHFWLSEPAGSKSFEKLIKTRVNEGLGRGGERHGRGEEGEHEESEERHDGGVGGLVTVSTGDLILVVLT